MTSTSAAPASPPSAKPLPARRPRGRFFLPLQWLPPLLVLLPLASRDSTFAQMTLLPFALAAIFSFLSVLVRVVFLLFRRGDPARLLRPALTFVLFCGVFAYVEHSKQEARTVAGELAATVQAACVRDGHC